MIWTAAYHPMGNGTVELDSDQSRVCIPLSLISRFILDKDHARDTGYNQSLLY